MSFRRVLLTTALSFAPVAAFAQTYASPPAAYPDAQPAGTMSSGGTNFLGQPDGTFSAGAKIGTLGIGGEVGYRPLQLFGVRLDGEAFSFDDDIRAGRTEYHATAELQSYGALADLYPFGESFRLTGGLRLNENQLRGNAQSIQTTVAGQRVDVPVDEFGELGAKVTFDKLSPYLGFGWGGTIAPGLNITTDFGVMFNGNPKASVDAGLNTNGVALSHTGYGAALVNQYASAGLASEQAQLQHYVNGYDFFPVIEIGLTYKF